MKIKLKLIIIGITMKIFHIIKSDITMITGILYKRNLFCYKKFQKTIIILIN